MSAETLRRAVDNIRADHGLNDTKADAALLATADWLERCAEIRERYPNASPWWVETAAIAVAREYLGEAS